MNLIEDVIHDDGVSIYSLQLCVCVGMCGTFKWVFVSLNNWGEWPTFCGATRQRQRMEP